MTRERYIRMTETTRRAVSRLPGGTKALRAPTLLCAAIYCASLLYLMFTGDRRIIRAVIVPAVCFAVVTVLRPLIGKQRPYDRYGVRSTIISTARQGIFLIPALLVFPNIWGLLGIQIAQPVADICTLVLCIAIVNGILRQLKAKEYLA